MSYTTQTRVQTAIPASLLVDALDDNRDGLADDGLLTEIIASADQAVDGFLAARYTVPFVTVPAIAAEASFVFACERIYDRREIAERNPWRERANYWRDRLAKIGDGTAALDASVETSADAEWNSRAKVATRANTNVNT